MNTRGKKNEKDRSEKSGLLIYIDVEVMFIFILRYDLLSTF